MEKTFRDPPFGYLIKKRISQRCSFSIRWNSQRTTRTSTHTHNHTQRYFVFRKSNLIHCTTILRRKWYNIPPSYEKIYYVTCPTYSYAMRIKHTHTHTYIILYKLPSSSSSSSTIRRHRSCRVAKISSNVRPGA